MFGSGTVGLRLRAVVITHGDLEAPRSPAFSVLWASTFPNERLEPGYGTVIMLP